MKKSYVWFLEFPSVVRWQILMWTIGCLANGVMTPLLVDMQGEMFVVSIITMYVVIRKLTAFMYLYIEDLEINTAIKAMLCIILMFIMSVPIYFVHKVVFLHMTLIIGIVFTFTVNSFVIQYDAWLGDKYGKEVFKRVQIIERVWFAAAGITGGVVSSIVIELTDSIWPSIVMVGIINITIFSIMLMDYNKHWKEEPVDVEVVV